MGTFVHLYMMGLPNKIASVAVKGSPLMKGSFAVEATALAEDVSDGRRSDHGMGTTLPIVQSGRQSTALMVWPSLSVKLAMAHAMKISTTNTETMRVTDLT